MRLTETTIKRLAARQSRYDVPDDAVPNLMVRVYPTGKRTWCYRYRFGGQGKRFLIGDAVMVSPTAARRRARSIAAKVAEGVDPNAEKARVRGNADQKRRSTLRVFLDAEYEPWLLTERRTGREIAQRIRANFGQFLDRSMAAIAPIEIERWRRDKHAAGRSPATTNRDFSTLRQCLRMAVAWSVIDSNPLDAVKLRRIGDPGKIRTITPEQESRLLAELRNRDARMRQERARFNQWRAGRGYELFPEHRAFVDHLEPVLLLLLNTGARLGEVLKLRWADVSEHAIVIDPEHSKTGHGRQIPLNAAAKRVLRDWESDSAQVFPGGTDAPLTTIKKSWRGIKKAADLVGVRLHDLRHTAATRMLRGGADIRTVQAILGHKNIATTARYLHTDEAAMRDAVDLLGGT